MLLKDVCKGLETFAPLPLQEQWDNSGLIVGDPAKIVNNALICFDITEKVLNEAINEGYDLVISHHPMVFKGLKKFNGSNETERLVIKAIRNDIAIYAAHTSFDNAEGGVSYLLGKKLGLEKMKTLAPQKDSLSKLIVFCPESFCETIRDVMFSNGGGQIGDYDSCSFSLKGEGTFRANESCNPFVGKVGEMHHEKEQRIEIVVPNMLLSKVISAMIKAHPYEEPAYDIIALKNSWKQSGSGVLGTLPKAESEANFLSRVKEKLGCKIIRHSDFLGKPIKKVAVCGGSGAFLISTALANNADVFITGDVKYHDFSLAENNMLIADAGHYETEQFCTELIFNYIKKNFTNFAARISRYKSNSVNYF